MKTKPSNIFAIKCSKKIFHGHSLSHYKILFYFSKDLAFRELKSGSTEALGEGDRQRLVLEKTLESSLDCKEIQPVHPKGNQSRIFIGSNDWCWSWNSNTLMRRTDSLEKTLMLGKTEGRRRREPQRMRWLNAITDLMDMEFVMDRKACSAAVHGVAKSQTQPSDYTELLKGYKLSVIREWPVAGRGTPSRAWEWALVYTRKWIVRGDTRADKGRDYWEGAPGKREEGWGTQENCSAACSQS